MKKVFNYLWNNLYNRYSFLILFILNIIAISLIIYYTPTVFDAGKGTGALGIAFALGEFSLILLILYITISIIYCFENKNKIKKIKDNLIIINKFYKIILILNILPTIILIVFLILTIPYMILTLLLMPDVLYYYLTTPINAWW